MLLAKLKCSSNSFARRSKRQTFHRLLTLWWPIKKFPSFFSRVHQKSSNGKKAKLSRINSRLVSASPHTARPFLLSRPERAHNQSFSACFEPEKEGERVRGNEKLNKENSYDSRKSSCTDHKQDKQTGASSSVGNAKKLSEKFTFFSIKQYKLTNGTRS